MHKEKHYVFFYFKICDTFDSKNGANAYYYVRQDLLATRGRILFENVENPIQNFESKCFDDDMKSITFNYPVN